MNESQSIMAILRNFLKQLHQNPHSYDDQFIKWHDFLNKYKNQQFYHLYLKKCLDYIPFNRRYWLQYLDLVTASQTQVEIIKQYQNSLNKNPKCFQVWVNYIQFLSKCKPQNLINYPIKKQIERAINEVGSDSNADLFYRLYFPLLTTQVSNYEFYKKTFTRALQNLEVFHDQFDVWLSSLSDDIIKNLYTREHKGNINSDLTIQQQRSSLKFQAQKFYKKTLIYRQERNNILKDFKWFYYQDRYFLTGEFQEPESQTIQDNLSATYKLLAYERKFGIVENTSYCYEKSLITHTQNEQLWQQVFHYLQNQIGKYPKVLSILRNNKQFFIYQCMFEKKNLFFYWCDLQQRQNINKARNMYKQLETIYVQKSIKHNDLHNLKLNSANITQIFLRHIQLQIRDKQWSQGKQIFDLMLNIYNQNLQLISYVLIQYVNYITKYYKDYEYPKKLLKMYFEHLPYNDYLFINYIEFMKNYENNQGYYDQLMSLIIGGLSKAKKTLMDHQYNKVSKFVKYHLRSVLGSIYLIKISQRKVMEIEGKD